MKTVKALISAAQLRSRLKDSNCAIVDARFYLAEPERGEREYVQAHIPGAVYAHLDRDLSAPMTGGNGRHPLPSVETMAETFSRFGIDDTVQVVVYDTASGFIAARAWWMLRYLGHDAVAVLDGGLPAWTHAGGALLAGVETREPRRFSPDARQQMLVSLVELESKLYEGAEEAARPSVPLLIDARAPERFRGEQEPLDPVAGHIPGAKNHFCKTNLNEQGTFRDQSALHEMLSQFTNDPTRDELICYCGSGVTACHNLLALEHAGLHGAKLYAGSWSEWCADPRRGIETGS